ncbi:trehalose-phosphatase [Coprinopsis cinerea okayama7|uniref:Trehalose-phosphatase n=1 Tax=Coprinopsis cinerea (strain Okayama-7 / 130 / ATCC MYA-4618 / FGSC 9003) TaxID=240176 RepID=A8NJX7_COPC7|nr:trehalose-phosphatase [Coprinopsis cinerea okayama7\|eukprot:XP_001834317.2 trehalose-phosphatase [Coprinopsis cinerea okayama7\
MGFAIPKITVAEAGESLRSISGGLENLRDVPSMEGDNNSPIHDNNQLLSTTSTTMSSFRNHRVIIASLFLPTTVVVGESAPPTPERNFEDAPPISIPAIAARLASEKNKPLKSALAGKSTPHSSHTRTPSASGPLKSIVEDLKDKSRLTSPAVRSPATETANPFTKLTRFAEDTPTPGRATPKLDVLAPTSPPAIGRKGFRADGPSSRLHRKSRSRSRRPTVASPVSPVRELDPDSDSWHFEPSTVCNGGLRNAIDSVGERLRKKVWVGTLGTPTDGFGEEVRKEIDERLLSQRESVPVWIPDDEFQSCYDEFCHQVLWPCLHYAVPDAPKTKMFYESATYKQYKAVNERFADVIASIYQEGDIIFVNDYHLMLLPLMLRKRLPNTASIGFFMHVAFPSSEIFRCLSVRKDLLLGVLGADFVGFQTANYARHFRQTVSRILAFEALPKGIQLPEDKGDEQLTEGSVNGKNGRRVRDGLADQGRFVDVASVPMGIDVVQLKERMEDPEVEEWVQVLKQRYAGMKLLGVRHKIAAFEAFLDKYPEWQGKVVLIQVALQTTESNELAGGVADFVSRINSRFSTLTYQPVVFLHTQDLTFSQYLALLTVGDAFIVTSLREGMALRTHEWVECQSKKHGALILSEFTGTYSYSGFRSCIAINPWDTRGTAKAIEQALTMSPEEARSRWEDLHNHVITQTAQNFVTAFLNRTLRSHVAHLASLSQSGTDPSAVPVLDLPRLLPRYKHSMKRLILIDFEGTLWRRDLSHAGMAKTLRKEDEWSEEDEDWPKESVEVLKALSEDRRNEVWVLSGLARTGVLGKVAKVVPKVGIVAENGCFIRTRTSRNSEGQWISMVSHFNLTWKSACLEILNYFTERTPGSFVEEREASVVWRFWSTDTVDETNPDRQWARRQAAEAQNHIFDSLGERFGLRIIPGKNSFLVLPNNISRSTAISAITHPGGPARSPYIGRATWMTPDTDEFALHKSAGGGYVGYGGSGGMGGDGTVEETDFLLAISSDERLLRRLNEDDGAETVSTSGKGTDARWRVDFEELGGMLKVLAGVTSP